jgi:HK97 gp10 family phage protein
MSSLLMATATFQPKDPRRFVDVVVLVQMFGKVRRAQAIIADHARSIVTVVSGELQGSIHATEPHDDFKQIIGEVVASATYAGFVEFGTGLRGIGTYPGPLPTSGVPYTGAWVYDFRKQNWRGMPAQPFMRPALDMARMEVLEEFRS